MKKFISIILITFLCIVNYSYAEISKQDQNKFDSTLKRIEQSQKDYRARKETLREDAQRLRRKKQEKLRAKKRKEAIEKKNRELADLYEKQRTLERRKRITNGCLWDAYVNNFVCK